MPNRILRDWTDSENIDILSVYAERFFIRLIMKADDYGRYNANVKFLRSTLFPLKTDIRESDISRWLTECKDSGLIVLYNITQKDYLQIENFKQTLRQKKEKFPAPTTLINGNASAMHTNSNCVPETKRNESESESETETEGEKKVFINEKFLIPEMMKEWKSVFKNYPDKKENDFPALREIAEFISGKEKIDFGIGIMPFFKQLSEYIFKHDFYKNYSLLQVSRHIQNIVNNINNNGHAINQPGNKSNRDKQADASQKLVDKLRSVTGTG